MRQTLNHGFDPACALEAEQWLLSEKIQFPSCQAQRENAEYLIECPSSDCQDTLHAATLRSRDLQSDS